MISISCLPPFVNVQAKEYGEAEVWMNERMMRTSPLSCAEFLGAFLDTPSTPVGPAGAAAGLGGCVWLVWKDEGECTLYDMMRQRDFPFNMEPVLLERPLRLPQDKRRRLVTFKLVLAELLEAMEAAHATGIGENGSVGKGNLAGKGLVVAVGTSSWCWLSCWRHWRQRLQLPLVKDSSRSVETCDGGPVVINNCSATAASALAAMLQFTVT